MTTREFNERLLAERFLFPELCREERVFLDVGPILPRLAPAFAEGLILDLDLEQTRIRIRADKPGAAGLVYLVDSIVGDRSARPALAASIPGDVPMTPFYLLCTLVLDFARSHPPPGKTDSGEAPRDFR